MSEILFIDTETTGVEEKDRLIEVAYRSTKDKELKTALFNPEMPIDPRASAVHGYSNMQVKNKPLFRDSVMYRELLDKNKKGAYFVAHNAPFDILMLQKEGVTWNKNKIIDTYVLSIHYPNELTDKYGHALQVIRYANNWDEQEEFNKMKQEWFGDNKKLIAHQADTDIFILGYFFKELKKEKKLTLEEMVKLSQTPADEVLLRFGNIKEFPKNEISIQEVVKSTYKQGKFDKAGYEYLYWALFNMDNLTPHRAYSLIKALALGYINEDIDWNVKEIYNNQNFKANILSLGVALIYNNEEIKKLQKMFNIHNNFDLNNQLIQKMRLSGIEIIKNKLKSSEIIKDFLINYIENIK